MTTTTTTRRGKALSLTAAGVSLVIGALVATLATTASAAPAAKHRVELALDGGTSHRKWAGMQYLPSPLTEDRDGCHLRVTVGAGPECVLGFSPARF